MSQENVKAFHKALEAFKRRDYDALLTFADPDVEFTSRLVQVEGGAAYRGHDGVRSWWESLLSVYPDFSWEIEEVRDLGDVTVARLRLRGHGIGSDAPMEQTAWQVVEWRHNKAIRWHVFLSETEALAAAGPSE